MGDLRRLARRSGAARDRDQLPARRLTGAGSAAGEVEDLGGLAAGARRGARPRPRARRLLRRAPRSTSTRSPAWSSRPIFRWPPSSSAWRAAGVARMSPPSADTDHGRPDPSSTSTYASTAFTVGGNPNDTPSPAREVAVGTAEVELEHRPLRQLAGAVERERVVEPRGLVDGDARARAAGAHTRRTPSGSRRRCSRRRARRPRGARRRRPTSCSPSRGRRARCASPALSTSVSTCAIFSTIVGARHCVGYSSASGRASSTVATTRHTSRPPRRAGASSTRCGCGSPTPRRRCSAARTRRSRRASAGTCGFRSRVVMPLTATSMMTGDLVAGGGHVNGVVSITR